MLEEVELLVARRVGEIVARRALAALLRAKRRIRQHDIVILEPLAEVGKRVAKEDWPFDAVQHGIHEREAVRVVNELTAGEGLLYLKVRHICREVGVVIRLGLDVLRGGDHEAERAAGGVVAKLAGLRLHELRHDIDEHARREVLARAGFLLVGVFLEQALVEAAEPFFLRGEPV